MGGNGYKGGGVFICPSHSDLDGSGNPANRSYSYNTTCYQSNNIKAGNEHRFATYRKISKVARASERPLIIDYYPSHRTDANRPLFFGYDAFKDDESSATFKQTNRHNNTVNILAVGGNVYNDKGTASNYPVARVELNNDTW